MLRQMRSGALSGFFMIFLLLGGVGLVLTDGAGFFTGGVSPSSVAQVGDEEVSFTEFDNTLRQFLNTRNLDTDIAYRAGVVDQILRDQIELMLLRQAGADKGLIVPDYLVAQRIKPVVNIIASGGISEEQALAQLARQSGMSVEGFINTVRDEYIQNLLLGAVEVTPAYIPEKLSRRLAQYEGETRSADILVLPHNDMQNVPFPSDEDLQAFYDSRKSQYALPETRVLTVALISPQSLREELSVSDEELRAEYNVLVESFTQPERRTIKQAVVEDEKTATAILKLAEEGMDLKQAIEEVTGSDDAFRTADSYDEAGLPPRLSAVVFGSSELNDVRGPVQTPLGWHVLMVTDIQPPRTKDFGEVKDEIKEEMVNQQLDSIMIETAAELDDELAGGADIKELAARYNMSLTTLGPLTQTGETLEEPAVPVEGMEFLELYEADQDYILENAFAIPPGETTQVLELEDGSIAAVQVTRVFPQRFKELNKLREQLTKKWLQKERVAANFERAQKTLDQLKSGELDLLGAATELDVQKETVKNASRTTSTDILSENAAENLFTHAINSYFLTPSDNSFLVGQITDVTLPDMAAIEDDTIDEITSLQVAQMNEETRALYVQSLADRYGVEINRKLLDRAYGGGTGRTLP